jgi:Cu(I)/Ag(I) efflux system periplasmic protein CusF
MKHLKLLLPLLAYAFLGAVQPTLAADATSKAAPHTSTALAWTAATVTKADPAKGTVTLNHEAITNLDMPKMTMPFQVRDAKLFKVLQAGAKVRFVAEDDKGTLVVTHAEAAK